jgi:hypothetical protein
MKKLLLLLVAASGLYAESVSVLFLISNEEEEAAFAPIIEQCEKKGVTCRTLTFEGKSDQLADQEEIEEICRDIQPRAILSGLNTLAQGQLLAAYKGVAKTFGFWNRLDYMGQDNTIACAVQKEADVVLLPLKEVALLPELASRPQEECVVVGHPLLDDWKEEVTGLDKKALLESVHADPERFTITYFGGKGRDYEASYPLFLTYVAQLEKDFNDLCKTDKEKLNIFVQTPDGATGWFEEKHSPDHFKIDELNDLEAVVVADLVASYNALEASQALVLGKDLIYFIPEGDTATNVFLEKGVVQRISSPADFGLIVNKARPRLIDTLVFNSAGRIADLLTEE